MTERTVRNKDLREACIHEGLAIIESDGVESLSLREVARRLGVSHQAPYKHFQSRDHILAAIVARAFERFAAYLDARPRGANPREDLAEMGRAYLAYAEAYPLQYRLMFGALLPDPAAHPEMMAKAQHAFSLLRDALEAVQPAAAQEEGGLDLDALFVWATVHGLASILTTCAGQTLALPQSVLEQACAHTLAAIGRGLER